MPLEELHNTMQYKILLAVLWIVGIMLCMVMACLLITDDQELCKRTCSPYKVLRCDITAGGTAVVLCDSAKGAIVKEINQYKISP